MLNACFPLGSLECWYMLGRGCLHKQSPIKTLGTEAPTSFPGSQQFMACCHSLLGELSIINDCFLISYGRRPLRVMPSFARRPQASLALANCVCYNNHHHKYDYILSPVSTLNKLLNLRVVLGGLLHGMFNRKNKNYFSFALKQEIYMYIK